MVFSSSLRTKKTTKAKGGQPQGPLIASTRAVVHMEDMLFGPTMSTTSSQDEAGAWKSAKARLV